MTHRLIALSPTAREELETLFHFQLDPQARYAAAFTAPDSTNQPAYRAKHAAFLRDPTITARTVQIDGVVAGSIAAFGVGRQV